MKTGTMDSEHKWEPKEFPRFWLLLETLEEEPRFKTVKELSTVLEEAGLGVDKRTVQRILNYFSDRFGLVSRKRSEDIGQPFEWAWSKEDGRPSIGTMDPPTALTYELAGQLLGSVLPGSVLESMEKDFRRARQVLAQTGKEAKAITQKVRILPRGSGRLPARINPQVLHNLYQALMHNHKVSVKYTPLTSSTKQTKSYQINPLGIVTRLDTLYLIHVIDTDQKDRDPDKVMEWPLHRFKEITDLGTKARTPHGFDLDEHIRNIGFMSNPFVEPLKETGKSLKLTLLAKPGTARYLAERPFGPDQSMKEARDGRIKVEATVPNTRELLTQLHDFAADIEILGPKVLRNYFSELAKQLYEQYTKQ